MRQSIKNMSLAVLLLFCMIDIKAAGKIYVETSNGTVTSSVSDGICTLTVTPNTGYYITINDITAVNYLDASQADSRTRSDGPSISDPITISGEDPSNLSQRRIYTFIMPDNDYDVKVSANFHGQTTITLDMFALSTTNYTYDGTVKEPELSATGLTADKDYTCQYINNKNAGTASVVITGISTYRGTINYNYSIAPATLTVIANDNTKVYGEDDPELAYQVTGLVDGDNMRGTLTRERGENVGTYNITRGSLTASSNYTIDYTGATFTITQKYVNDVRIDVNGTNLVYDGKEKRPSVTVYDGRAIISAAEYTVEYENNTDAGDASLTVVDVSGGNYVLTSTTATFNIARAQLTVTADNKAKEYGDDDPELTYQTIGLAKGETLTGHIIRESGEKLGSYPITQGTLEASDNYVVTFIEGTFTITQKHLTNISIVVDESGIVYDGEEKKPSVTVKNGDNTIDESEYTVSYSNNIDAGAATVTVISVAGSNYYYVSSANFSIAKAPLNWKTSPKAKEGMVYNGEPQKLMRIGTAKAGTVEYSRDGKKFSKDNPQETDAGDYEVWYRLDGGQNYESIDAVSTIVTIKEAEQVITTEPEAYALTYNGGQQALIKEGSAENGEMQYSIDGKNFTTKIPTAVDAKNYDVWYRVVGHKNYKSIEPVLLTVRIAKAGEPPFTAPTIKSLIYTGTDQALLNAGTVEGGVMQYSIDGNNFDKEVPQATLPQDYIVWYRVMGDENHADIEPASLTVTIEPAPLTIKADDKIITVGDPIPNLTYRYDGFVNGETAENVITKQPKISTTANVTSDVGFYPISISVEDGAAANYNIIPMEGHLTISPTLSTEEGEDVAGHIKENDEGEVSVIITELSEDLFISVDLIPVTEDGRLDIPTSVLGSDGETYPVTEVASEVFDGMTIAAIVVLPEGVRTSNPVTNVVNGDGTCQVMDLSEVQTIEIPITIEIETVIYEREVTQSRFTVCLPYETSVPEGCKAFSLKANQGGTALFDQVTNDILEPNQPYVVEKTESASARSRGEAEPVSTTINLSGTNAIIDPTRPEEFVEKGGLKMYGCITGLTHREGVEKQAYILQPDYSWQMTASSASEDADKVYLAPFQAYLCSTDDTPVTDIASVFEEEETGISVIEIEKPKMAYDGFYDLSGRKVQPRGKGLYIRNGKKVLIK